MGTVFAAVDFCAHSFEARAKVATLTGTIHLEVCFTALGILITRVLLNAQGRSGALLSVATVPEVTFALLQTRPIVVTCRVRRTAAVANSTRIDGSTLETIALKVGFAFTSSSLRAAWNAKCIGMTATIVFRAHVLGFTITAIANKAILANAVESSTFCSIATESLLMTVDTFSRACFT